MTLQAENINEMPQGKDFTERSYACFRCRVMGNSVIDCTLGRVDMSNEAASSPIVGKMQMTLTADSSVTDGLLKLLFKELINQNTATNLIK